MQSHRKDSGSYLSRLHTSSSANLTPKFTANTKRKSSVATQTDYPPYFGLPNNFTLSTVDDIKEQYLKTLEFLNNCHDFINGVMSGGFRTFGDAAVQKPFEFRVPEVPNYFNVLEIFLDQYKNQSCPDVGNFIGSDAFRPQNKAKSRRMQTKPNEEQIIFDVQHFLPKNMGDGPTYVTQPPAVPDSKTDNNAKNVSFNDDVNKLGGRAGRATSPTRTMRSEKGIVGKNSHQDLKTLSTTFEEILKTCNEFENKSIEYLLKNDVPLNEPPAFPKNFGSKDKFALGDFEQGDQEPSLKKQQDLLERTEPLFIKDPEHLINNAPQPSPKGFNLLEYALRNCKPISEEPDSPPTSPKSQKLETMGLLPNKGLLAENLPNLLVNIKGIVANTSRPLAMLNQPHQCQSPKRVNELFQKISKEELNGPEDLNDSGDSEEFIRFIEYGNKSLTENCCCTEPNCDPDVSSSESIILTDEEFQRKIMDNSVGRKRERVGTTKRCRRSEEKLWESYLVEAEPEIPIKSNPLKLNDKDKSLADEKVLRTIGLFNEKGDIRPGVISILEEKQRVSLTQNSTKNVKFRTERKFDLEVRFNNNNMKLTENTSEESLGGNSATTRHNMASVTGSGCSSVGTISSCSTISESVVLNSNPNDDKALIKKFN